jgi:hypothetical protein
MWAEKISNVDWDTDHKYIHTYTLVPCVTKDHFFAHYRQIHKLKTKITENKLSVFFRIFEKVRQYFGQQGESIPMSFVLGFYVSLIVKRWWEQYRLLPWPDSLALFVSASIPGVVSTCALRD